MESKPFNMTILYLWWLRKPKFPMWCQSICIQAELHAVECEVKYPNIAILQCNMSTPQTVGGLQWEVWGRMLCGFIWPLSLFSIWSVQKVGPIFPVGEKYTLPWLLPLLLKLKWWLSQGWCRLSSLPNKMSQYSDPVAVKLQCNQTSDMAALSPDLKISILLYLAPLACRFRWLWVSLYFPKWYTQPKKTVGPGSGC